MSYNTIKLKNYLKIIEEYPANAGTILPGHLLEFVADGTTVDVKKHATAGGNCLPKMFALENELEGEGITDGYATDEKVSTWIPQAGDEVYVLLKDGENVSIGDPLESAGDGTLQKHTADVESFESAEAGSITVLPNQIVGVAMEAMDVSGGSSADTETYDDYRIKIKIV